MPGVKCGGCARFASALEGARCGKCNALYCRICGGIPANAKVTSKWRCPECKKNVARDNRNETPVRGPTQSPLSEVVGVSTIAGSSTPNTSASSLVAAATPPPPEVSTVNTTIRELSPVPTTDLHVILVELKAVRAEIQAFRKEMEVEMLELKTTMNTCSTRIDGLEARVDALEQRAISGPTNSDNVGEIVEELRRELNDRDQELLANDIEVSNLPEEKAENPTHIIKAIGHKLGISLEDRDIVSAERVGGRQLNATNSAGPTVTRSRPIVVRLARRDLRDQLLAGARVRRGATTTDLGMSGPAQRFFLNERLTKVNRSLFRQAREAAGALGWKFVWTKQGRILARKAPGDKAQRIRTEGDLSHVFGTGNKTAELL
uniref:FP protein C-terminal domain-containing protein n=1 Tax=Heliothis virescens TaxID=7102 RepID=A0A2A4ITG1_HELVI